MFLLYLLSVVELLLLMGRTTVQQSCLEPADLQNRPIPFRDDNGSPRLPSGTQAIITSYQFQCCGNITEWRTFVQPGGGMHDGVYSITFQVWRPVADNGCYSLVGDNVFPSVTLEDGNEDYDADGDSRVEGEVNETPLTDVISFQPGDVVGYFAVSSKDSDNEGIQLDEDYTDESVWYHTNTDESPLVVAPAPGMSCDIQVGPGRTLSSSTNAAPVLSVLYGLTSTTLDTFPCPTSTLPTVMMTSSEVPTPTITTDASVSATNTASNGPIASTPEQTQDTSPSLPPLVVATGNDNNNNDNNNVPVVVGVVIALLLLVMIVVISIILIVIVLRKRMTSSQSVRVKGDTIGDLSNPNYESSLLQSAKEKVKKKTNKKKKSSPALHLADPQSTPYDAVYSNGSMNNYPKSSPTVGTDPGANNYSYISTERAEPPRTEEGDGLYHVLGPDAGKRKMKPLAPPPVVPPRNATGDGTGLYNTPQPEEAAGGWTSHYEDPNFHSSLSTDKGMFDSIGTYVPTEEQRRMFASNYEMQEDIPAHNIYNKLQFFVEDQIYWAPASTTSDLYAQLALKKYREMPRNQIRILNKIGSGQFGEVCKALWTVDGNTLALAVKTLVKSGASEEDKVKFLQEAAIMGQFSHPNVIKLYGVVTVGEPIMICSELLANGDLRSYLQSITLRGSSHKDFTEIQTMFLKFARDIASGMDYLSGKSFVHRDLAARNVLLDESLTCKIGDFGMARDLMDDTYYKSSGGQIPVKWTAPEALLYKRYSPDSDVWSYGMVLFEIWSVAKKPFSTITNTQVLRLIQTGFCQAPPPGCPRAIYELMVECWNPDHEKRPSFKEIHSRHLQQSSTRLLYWSPKDNSLSPSVGVLGAPLQAAFKLHLDLQEKYKQSSFHN